VPTGHSRRVHALLHCQGETAEEVASIARTLRARSVPVDVGLDTLDIVGTGGDGIGSVNISTGACVIAAAAGARVAKHGSRSVSSLCGSADVLEVLHPPADPASLSGAQEC
jgi:anthranilate phosphoribosyltransferase